MLYVFMHVRFMDLFFTQLNKCSAEFVKSAYSDFEFMNNVMTMKKY